MSSGTETVFQMVCSRPHEAMLNNCCDDTWTFRCEFGRALWKKSQSKFERGNFRFSTSSRKEGTFLFFPPALNRGLLRAFHQPLPWMRGSKGQLNWFVAHFLEGVRVLVLWQFSTRSRWGLQCGLVTWRIGRFYGPIVRPQNTRFITARTNSIDWVA